MNRTFIGGLAFCFLASASIALAAPAVDIEVAHRVHPVLTRQPNVEMGQIVLKVSGTEPVGLKSISLSLDGTTDLADIESVEILDTGKENRFAPGKTFGSAAEPKASLTFTGDRKLAPGANVFWISGKLRDSATLGHRVKADCVAVETSAGTLKPKSSPNPGHRVGVALRQAGEDGVHTYRIPALGTTSKGTLLCVYDIRRRSSRDLQGDIDVGLSRSTDGGQTWEPMRVIMDMGEYGGLPQSQNGIGDPGLVIDQQTGEIFVFALWVHAKPGKHQWKGDGSEPGFEIGKTAQFMLVRSTDDGQTWSEPENLTRLVKRAEWILFAPSPQQGIQLKDGTLVMPVQGRSESGPFATIMTSGDHGKTWTVAEGSYAGGNECQAAELGDGSIMLNVRNDGKKRRAVLVTKDLGYTWEKHLSHERDHIEPTCNGSLYRWINLHDSSTRPLLLFANPNDEKLRVRHAIQVSGDDGQSWPSDRLLLLDEGRGFGYPSLSRVDDDTVGIVYEGSQAHLVFERIARSELMGADTK